jgi:hypothetical protein
MKIQSFCLNSKYSNLAAWRENGRLATVAPVPDRELTNEADAAIPLQPPDAIPGLP